MLTILAGTNWYAAERQASNTEGAQHTTLEALMADPLMGSGSLFNEQSHPWIVLSVAPSAADKSAVEQIAAERAQHALAWTIVWPVSASQVKLVVEHTMAEISLDDSPRGWESLAAEMGEKRGVIRKACADYMVDNGQRLRSAQRKKPGDALQYDSRTVLLDRLIATISFLDEAEALAYTQSVRSLEPTSAKGSFPLLNDFLRPTTPWRQVMAVVTQARDEEDEQLRRAWAWQVRSKGPQAVVAYSAVVEALARTVPGCERSLLFAGVWASRTRYRFSTEALARAAWLSSRSVG